VTARYNLKEVSMAEKDKSEKDRDEIESFGQLSLSEKDDESIKLITIIGEIEGHEVLSNNCKTTKYEHLIPIFARIEDSKKIKGALIIINTIGVAILINIYPNVHIVKLFSALIYLLQPLIFNLYVKKKYKINKKTEPDKQALAQRWDGLGINIAAFIHNNTDVVILTLLADLKSVSIYSVYYLVTTGLKNLITSISGGIVPTLGHAYAESNSEKLNKIFDRYELIIYDVCYL